MSDVANLHVVTDTVLGVTVGPARLFTCQQMSQMIQDMTYPVSTDGDVEDDEQGTLAKRLPSVGVSNLSTSHSMETSTISVPGDALRSVVAASTIKLDSPDVVVAIGEINVGSDTIGLVADSTGGSITVNSTVTDPFAIDVLHNINLTALGPFHTLTDGITKKPKRRPDTLLASSRVTTQSKLSFNTSNLPSLRGQSVLALDSSRSPASIRPSGDELKRVLACLADVVFVLDVGLDFIVEILFTLDNVPYACVGVCVCRALEPLGPDSGVA